MSFEITADNLNDLVANFKKAPQIVEPILQRAVEGSAAIFAKHTLKSNPVPFRSGNLLQSFKFFSGRLYATWRPTANYAANVEFGTGIYGPSNSRIYPTTARVLSWIGGGTAGKYVTSASGRRRYQSGTQGGRVFYRSIAGQKAHPYMGAIRDNSRDDINRLFAQAAGLISAAMVK